MLRRIVVALEKLVKTATSAVETNRQVHVITLIQGRTSIPMQSSRGGKNMKREDKKGKR
jgi:hypothetical protein